MIRDKAKLGQERHAARIELAAVLPKVADAIEDELVRASGNNPPPRRRRCRGIDAKWKPVLRYKDRQALDSAATRWALQACRDLHKRPSDQVQLDWNTVLSGGIQAQQTASDLAASYIVRQTVVMHGRLANEQGQWDEEKHRLLGPDLDQLLETATTVHEDTTNAETAFARRSWKEWLQEDSNAGNKHAHDSTRLPKEWTPASATDAEGAITADPHAIISEEWSKFRKLWHAATNYCGWWDPGNREHSNGEAGLPSLEHSALRQASCTFSHGTSSTYDGLHPRHFALLSNPALDTVGALLEAIEWAG